MTSPDRAAALAALVANGARTGESLGDSPELERTGNEVKAGGDTARLLVRDGVALSYVEGGILRYAQAGAGDVILVSAKQARRLDELGVTVDPDSDLDAVEDTLEDGRKTDEQLEAMTAPELVAHVAQHPDERERVRVLEEARRNPRKTVLTATEPTPEADLDAQDEQAARLAELEDDTAPGDEDGEDTGAEDEDEPTS